MANQTDAVRRIFDIVTGLSVALSVATQYYVASTAQNLAVNWGGALCVNIAAFQWQAITIWNRTILYGLLLIPFIQRAWAELKNPDAQQFVSRLLIIAGFVSL